MELVVELDTGPVNAEFSGEDWSEVEPELQGLINFLEKNHETLSEIAPYSTNPQYTGDVAGADGAAPNGGLDSEASGEADSKPDEGPLASLVRKTGKSVEGLDDLVYVDPDGEELPQVLAEKSVLGGSKAERQRNAAYMILAVWDECYGEERMKTSDFKDILTMSGISDNNLYNAWVGAGKGDFHSTGQGPSATVGLTGPGKRQALKVFQSLADSD